MGKIASAAARLRECARNTGMWPEAAAKRVQQEGGRGEWGEGARAAEEIVVIAAAAAAAEEPFSRFLSLLLLLLLLPLLLLLLLREKAENTHIDAGNSKRKKRT